MSRFLALTGSSEFAHRVSLALASGDDLQVLDAPAVQESPPDALNNVHSAVDVVVVGPDIRVEHWVALAAALEASDPAIVVVLAAAPSPEVTLNALRSGIRDIIDPAVDAADLSLALQRAAHTAANRRQPAMDGTAAQTRSGGRIISVMSPKGGVGKTTVSTNLAVGLARSVPKGAVIVDLDLQFGDVASGLGLEPAHTITDAVHGSAAADTMVLKAFLAPHPSGAYALCAPLVPAEADLIKPSDVVTLVRQLSLEFPYVILDTSPGLGEVALAVLELATDAVWVCGMDIPSIRGLNHGLEVLRQLDLMPASNAVVLNFADKRTGLTVRDVETTIGLPVEIVLPHSRAVPFSTNAGVTMIQTSRRGPVTKGLAALLNKIETGTPAAGARTSRRRVAVS